MKGKIVIMFSVLAFFLAVATMANAQSYQQQNQTTYNQGPSYNYFQHSQDSYNRSIQNYNNNPTQHNYQIMQQREQVYDMRQQQYQQNNWSPQGNSSRRP